MTHRTGAVLLLLGLSALGILGFALLGEGEAPSPVATRHRELTADEQDRATPPGLRDQDTRVVVTVLDESSGSLLPRLEVAWVDGNGRASGVTTEDGHLTLPEPGRYHFHSLSKPAAFESKDVVIREDGGSISLRGFAFVKVALEDSRSRALVVSESQFTELAAGHKPEEWFETLEPIGLPADSATGAELQWTRLTLDAKWRVVAGGPVIWRVVPAHHHWRTTRTSDGGLRSAKIPFDRTCPASDLIHPVAGESTQLTVHGRDRSSTVFHLGPLRSADAMRIMPAIKAGLDFGANGWSEIDNSWDGAPNGRESVSIDSMLPIEHHLNYFGWFGSELRCGMTRFEVMPDRVTDLHLDRFTGPYALSIHIRDELPEAMWRLVCDGPDDQVMIALGRRTFTAGETLKVRGLVGTTGRFDAQPNGGESIDIRFDLDRETNY